VLSKRKEKGGQGKKTCPLSKGDDRGNVIFPGKEGKDGCPFWGAEKGKKKRIKQFSLQERTGGWTGGEKKSFPSSNQEKKKRGRGKESSCYKSQGPEGKKKRPRQKRKEGKGPGNPGSLLMRRK